MENLNSREIAEKLWDLLDAIDGYTDTIDKNNPDHLKAFYDYAYTRYSKRFELLQSDGYRLYNKEEWDNYLLTKPVDNSIGTCELSK